jgi:hypothetical protein
LEALSTPSAATSNHSLAQSILARAGYFGFGSISGRNRREIGIEFLWSAARGKADVDGGGSSQGHRSKKSRMVSCSYVCSPTKPETGGLNGVT